jgi:protein-disulfide isomerase
MRISNYILFASLAAMLAVTACTKSSQDIKAALEQHPEWIADVMKKNPEKFAEVLQSVEMNAQRMAQQKAQEQERAQQDEEFKNPKQAEITDATPFRGPKNAPITIVEYSDFQCPYCQRAFLTVKELEKKYGDKVRLVYKNTPLPFHPLAMPAAKRFAAIAMQSTAKAYEYHDRVFEGQNKLTSDGEKFLDEMAKKVGANMAKMKKDMESETVKNAIAADMAEAAKFQFSGTPGFLVAGVSLKGAYPASAFEAIIDRKLSGGEGNRDAASADKKAEAPAAAGQAKPAEGEAKTN